MDPTSSRAATSAVARVAHGAGERLFTGGGEVGTILAGIDWARSPLGPVEAWPRTLRTSLRICLTSRHDIILWWGPDLRVFYNDAYAPTLGIHHPAAVGQPGREVWAEIWDVIGPMLEGVLRTGQPTWSYDQLLYLERNGYPEETYHTYSYSPIEDDNGDVGGVFTAVTETTPRVLAERRAVAARDMATAVADARTAEDVASRALRALAADPNDVPFALLYLLDREGRHAHMAASVGLVDEAAFAPPMVDLAAKAPRAAALRWPLARVARRRQREIVSDLPRWPGPALTPPALMARALPPRAIVLPVTEPGQVAPSALLVAGVNPHRALDDEYERFYVLLATHLASALASAHAYEEERRRAEALAVVDRAKTAFFSNVSHEFRTPLTLMLGPIEDSLADAAHPLAPEQRARQEMVRRNGLRLLKLVNTLLDFSRIEAGRVQASYEPTDLAAYTAELASAFRSLVEKAGLRLVVLCPPLDEKLAAPVYVDREMWEKIVLNLLSNAFKFTFTGEIAVALRPAENGKSVALMVRDTGVGIPAAELPRLFERFHRVEGMRARTHEGSGIGLALVRELVHLHGGTIRAVSLEGVGTTFSVRLPVGTAHLPADRVQALAAFASSAMGAAAYVGEAARWLVPTALDGPALDGPALEGALVPLVDDDLPARRATYRGNGDGQRPARILLADDNADMRDYLARLLGGQNAVETVVNGAAALAAIRRDPAHPPDLVLADVMMPELDGFGLLRALRANPATATLPVIMLSARAGEEATAEGLAAGADDYLVKPFSAREVLSRVAARLEIARTRAEAERRLFESLSALMGMARALVAPPTEEPVADAAPGARPAPVRRVLELVQGVFQAQVAGAALLSFATNGVDPLAVVGLTPEIETQWWNDLRAKSLSDYLPPQILERMRAEEVIELDLSARPPVPGQDYFGIQNILTVTQRLAAEEYIIVAVEVRDRPPFTPRERDLMQAAIRLVTLAVERDRLLLEQAAGQARELALRETTRRMDEFLGIASHELRTPLTSITANVQLARRQLARSGPVDGARPLVERSQLLLERADRQAARLDRLVGDLLDVTRIQAGKLEMRPESCDLLAIAREAVAEQRAVWPGRVITLDLPRRASLVARVDGERVGQVLTNFLTNALKYSREDQAVAVRIRVGGASVRVKVRDGGPGLTEAEREHLFERFYRVPGIVQQSGSGVGLGLGLHISKTIVERHGGAVGVDSTSGQGSTFWFTLPLGTGSAAGDGESPE